MRRLILLCLVLTPAVFALEDSPATRAAEAQRYLAVYSPQELMPEMIKPIADNLPAEVREKFIKTMTVDLDYTAINAAMKASLVKHFTADELKALADFYNSPAGKSGIKKTPLLMADLMPVMQAEMGKSIAKLKGKAP